MNKTCLILRSNHKIMWEKSKIKKTSYFESNEKKASTQKFFLMLELMGLPRFELEFLAPKAKRMDQATPQALVRFVRFCG